MEQHSYRYLQELLDSDFQIVDGEPNIIGWEVKNEANEKLGKVKNLLFDPQTRSVRYLIVDLEHMQNNLNNKTVMVPIGIAHLHVSEDEVVLPNIHLSQFVDLPDYKFDEIGPETEVHIRNVIGSPAALRIKEEVEQFDQDKFYNHDHFIKDDFYIRGGNPNRVHEERTIHNLVDNSLNNSLSDPESQAGIPLNHDEQHEIKPWLQEGASHNQGEDQNKTTE